VKTLVFGAGVIGSFNAAMLKRGGADVTLLARGERLVSLREHGVILTDWRTGDRTVTRVPLVDRIAVDDRYDVIVVVVRRDQIPSVLPVLADVTAPTLMFVGNNLAGTADITAAVGARVLTGLPNAGGQRDGESIRYIFSKRLPLIFGECDGTVGPRARAIATMFGRAGLPARVVADAEAYQKTHAAGLPAFAGSLYSAGGDVRRLARRPELLSMFTDGYRDALRALVVDGTAIRPRATTLLMKAPQSVLQILLRRFLDSNLAVIGGQAHALAAVEEMAELADELRVILRRTGVESPANERAFAAISEWAVDERPVGDN
jgi:2-dehydropantoate 2-reductase